MNALQKGFVGPLLLIFVALLLVGGGAYVYMQKKQVNQLVNEDRDIKAAAEQVFQGMGSYQINNELANNKNGYASSCSDDGVVSLWKIASLIKTLKGISNSVVCKDSISTWALSVQMKSNPSQYLCLDNTHWDTSEINNSARGSAAIRDSAITTTNCK